MRFAPRPKGLALALATSLGLAASVSAQPAGWGYVDEVRVFNHSAQDVAGYQLALELDAVALAAENQLRPDAGDLRFGLDTAGTQPLPYWVQSGLGTRSMLVWIRLPRLAPSTVTRFYMYRGNPAATQPEAGSLLNTLNVFDFADMAQNSAHQQRGGGKVSVAPHSVRGMRFEARRDLLAVALGKNEPQGSARVVTLWDVPAKKQLMQLQVSGPAGQYGYALPAAPVWLPQGGEYMLTLQQGAGDGYYYSENTQLNPAIGFLGTRYCNQCNASTLPTLGLPGVQYGYADLVFLTRQQVTPEPDYEYENIIRPPDPVEPEPVEPPEEE